ncbi:MAG: serine protease [Nitrospinales bacterium]
MLKNKNRKTATFLLIVLGIVALHNQRLSVSDPESTYPKRIRRAIRLWLDPPANELERHLIGKNISCGNRARLYKAVASATVVIKSGGALGAGVFIGPRLIATAAHVVEGGRPSVFLADVKDDSLAKPGIPVAVAQVRRVRGPDLAFIVTRRAYTSWLKLEWHYEDSKNLMVVGHPNGKYYSIQKARIKKKGPPGDSEFIVFKDNEIFFGNSGGAIVNCNGSLVGVVSMMSNYQTTLLKRGIGVNSRAIAAYADRLGVR